MSSDRIDPADLTRRLEPDSSPSEIVDWQQRLRSIPHEKSPSPFLKTDLERIDRFEIIRMLGQGGMGRVYLAIDSKLDRKVAIKVPLFDSDTDQTILERFRREGRAAGAVSHPNVVAVHEVGDTDQGFYIVSKYVEGPTLREYFAQHGKRLPARTAASLVAAIARGVQAAHLKGVIHRDLKPSNVLLERRPADDAESHGDSSEIQIDDELIRPKVADFGLAGFVDQRTAITMSGALVGTPSYMAPEQISGVPLGPQADVFSLGVILYELATGASPFTADSYVATIDRVQHHEPPALRKTHSGIPRDLSAICECAISKEPLRRYNTAGELADDLDRYLRGTPVRARSLGLPGRLQRWVRRHPAQAALAAVICLALLTSLIQNRRLQTSLERSDELQKDLASSATELTDANAKYRETIYVQDMIAAFDGWDRHAIDDVKTLLSRHVPSTSEPDLRGIEWYWLSDRVRAQPPREFLGHTGEVYDLAVTPDRNFLFSLGEDKTRRFWDLATGDAIRISPSERIGKSHAIAISPDGEHFFTGGNALKRRKVVDGSLDTGKSISRHTYGIRAVAVSPDSQYVASLCLQHQIHINRIAADEGHLKMPNATPSQRCTRIDFSPDSKRLYFCKQSDSGKPTKVDPNQFVVWDIESEQEIFSAAATGQSALGAVDASPDGLYVAIGANRQVQLFDTKRQRFSQSIRATRSRILDVEFSPNGRLLAAGGRNGTLSVLDVGKAGTHSVFDTIYQVRHHSEPINCVAWIDDTTIITGDDGGRVLLHELVSDLEPTSVFDAHTCRLLTNGTQLLVIDDNGNVSIIDLRTGRTVHQLTAKRSDTPHRMNLDARGERLAVTSGNRLQLWNLNNLQLQCEMIHQPQSQELEERTFLIHEISFAPDGESIATVGGVDATVIVWDVETGVALEEIALGQGNMGRLVTFSPDGARLFCAGTKDSLIFDITEETATAVGIPRIEQAEWISPSQVLISNIDGLLGIYDSKNKRIESLFSDQSAAALRMALSSDLRSLVTADDLVVQFWHVPTQRLIGSVPIGAQSIAFAPDGSELYLTSQNPETNKTELRVISKTP